MTFKRSLWKVLFIASALVSNALAMGPGQSSGSGGSAGSATPPSSPGSLPSLGTYRNTYYYLLPESTYANDAKKAIIRDANGAKIASVSAKFKSALDIEGSGKLLDGRVVNYIAKVNGEVRYRVVADPYGRGVGTCALEPFHSIAIDPNRIALGATVYIDETAGMLMPDGSHHNGIWRAVDIGSAIKKDRVDLFVGEGVQGGKVLDQAGIDHMQPLTIRLLSDPPSPNCADGDPNAIR